MKIVKINRSDSGKKTTRFYLDFTDNGGQRHKLAGYESRQKTETLRDRINELLTLDYQGKDATPELLNWFNDEPERMRKRLVEWGLLPETKAPEPPKTIKEHLTDYELSLRTRRKSDTHVKGTISRVKTVAAFCGWKTADDITAFGVESFIQNRQGDVSGVTLGNYQTACKMFAAWLRKHRRIDDNPLKDVLETIDTETTPRGVLNPEQFQTLIESTFASDEIRRGATGQERAVLYMTAGLTGYRRGELLAMRWADVRLEAASPVILLDAGKTKSGKDAAQQIPPGLVKMLTVWQAIQDPTPAEPLFPTFNRNARPSEWIRADLQAAGLPTKDSEGRKIDFHSLRVSYISFLANSNTPLRITQKLARHSTPVLTMNVYAKAFPEQERAALACLPGADFGAEIFSVFKAVECATVNVTKTPSKSDTFIDYSGQIDGQDNGGEKGQKAALSSEKRGFEAMGRGGFEPPTHGFSVRARQVVNTEKQKTYVFGDPCANTNVTILHHENPDLFRLIQAWPGLPAYVQRRILAMAGIEGGRV